MKVNYELLRTLHRILQQIADLNEQIGRGPKRIKIVKAAETDFSKQVEQSKQDLVQAKMLADEKQLTLDQREAKIVDLKSKLNACESNREYQLLNEQIAADQQANSVQSDEILELLVKIDTLESELQTAIGNFDKAKQESEKTQREVDQQLATLNSELERVKSELESEQAKLPIELRSEYARLVANNGENALSATDAETCGNCYTTLTAQTINELMLRQPVFCKKCGCLMYLSESHPAAS